MRAEQLDGELLGVGLDEGVHHVAEIVVGQTDHRARVHALMLQQRGLHLGRVDVRPAAEDHVACPVGEVQVAVGIEVPHVAE